MTTSARRAHRRTDRYERSERRSRLTLDDLRARDARAHQAFVDFTEAQTAHWELSVGPDGDIWAEDWQMDARVQWIPQIGRWE